MTKTNEEIPEWDFRKYGGSTVTPIPKQCAAPEVQGSEQPDCNQHKKEVCGITDMKVLAEMIGDLHYETLIEFFDKLSVKLHADAAKDRDKGRLLLAHSLDCLAGDMYNAKQVAEGLWQISKPFMKQ